MENFDYQSILVDSGTIVHCMGQWDWAPWGLPVHCFVLHTHYIVKIAVKSLRYGITLGTSEEREKFVLDSQ